jgi:exopolyphosphatase/guanosine-5'-triphosphate,3'-diphosphate pyrophosphatase
MVATSATRDAANSAEFTRRVKEVLGVEPEVVSGASEAMLSFTGATRELAGSDELAGSGQLTGSDRGPFLVADIGGGSTEFVVSPESAAGPDETRQIAVGARQPAAGTRHISVNIGCVRITERRLHTDPPTEAEIAAATADIDAALDRVAAEVPVTEARTLVGLAGSVTTIAGIALGLDGYDSERIHHSRVTAAQVHSIAARLLAQTRAERARIPVMHPGRIDVIGAGALILDRVMTRFAFNEVLVSEHDILDGLAWSLIQ